MEIFQPSSTTVGLLLHVLRDGVLRGYCEGTPEHAKKQFGAYGID